MIMSFIVYKDQRLRDTLKKKNNTSGTWTFQVFKDDAAGGLFEDSLISS